VPSTNARKENRSQMSSRSSALLRNRGIKAGDDARLVGLGQRESQQKLIGCTANDAREMDATPADRLACMDLSRDVVRSAEAHSDRRVKPIVSRLT
jgi:hypothetical protein